MAVATTPPPRSGLGAIHPGDASVSLGTSGVLWATTAGFAPNRNLPIHAFCHAIPNTWHQMGVILSAASSLSWWAHAAKSTEKELLADLGDDVQQPSPLLFMPYLSGERTPHNDPNIRGAFYGISHDTSRGDITQSVLEGVALRVSRLPGGTHRGRHEDHPSRCDRRRLAVAPLGLHHGEHPEPAAEPPDGGEAGGAFGAARLGRMAATGESPSAVCKPPNRVETNRAQARLGRAVQTRPTAVTVPSTPH